MLTVQEVYYHKPASGGSGGWDQHPIDYINDWDAVKKRWAERTARYERLGRGRKAKQTEQVEDPLGMV